MSEFFLSSLTRIADLDTKPFRIERLPRERWADADYVVGEVVGRPTELYRVELSSGRLCQVMPRDYVIGAFGAREATLEGVGSWHAIEDDAMHALTSAGLFGRFTGLSMLIPPPMCLRYHGHVVREGSKVTMADFVKDHEHVPLESPVVLLIGTSMSAGKTTTGRIIVHELANLGLDVVGAKLTGAGRYRDVLCFQDAGADAIFDFVDVGLPSTVVPEAVFRRAVRPLISRIAARRPDVVVVEAGASPLEPYNGAAAVDELSGQVRCTVLCASDPYAVKGVRDAFRIEPDLVAGPAAATPAAKALVNKLTGLNAVNVLDADSLPELRAVLASTLGIRFPAD
jgi:hypothetical protein